MKFLKKNLFLQVIFAMLLGILVGLLFPQFGTQLKIFATIFIRLIKMVIAPIIFVSIILGVNSHRKHHDKIGSLAVRTLVYFELMSILATLLTFLIVIIWKPGKGIGLAIFGSGFTNVPLKAPPPSSIQDFLIHIVPDNLFGTLTSENFIAIVILGALFAVTILKLPQPDKIIHFFEESNRILFKMIGLISKLSPVAAFGAMASLIGQSGGQALYALTTFIIAIWVCMIIFFIILVLIGYLYGFNVFKLLLHIKTEMLVALGTSSSESVFPQLMQKLESFGCSQKIVSFVLPTGYAFNLDGTAIYVTAAVFFIQQIFQIPLTVSDYCIILGTILIVSKGAAGVAGAGFVTLSAVLVALPGQIIPIEGLAILLGIDRLMSDARTVTNVIGNSVGTVLIAKAENEFKAPAKST